jgi:hypothetical protein
MKGVGEHTAFKLEESVVLTDVHRYTRFTPAHRGHPVMPQGIKKSRGRRAARSPNNLGHASDCRNQKYREKVKCFKVPK